MEGKVGRAGAARGTEGEARQQLSGQIHLHWSLEATSEQRMHGTPSLQEAREHMSSAAIEANAV